MVYRIQDGHLDLVSIPDDLSTQDSIYCTSSDDLPMSLGHSECSGNSLSPKPGAIQQADPLVDL